MERERYENGMRTYIVSLSYLFFHLSSSSLSLAYLCHPLFVSISSSYPYYICNKYNKNYHTMKFTQIYQEPLVYLRADFKFVFFSLYSFGLAFSAFSSLFSSTFRICLFLLFLPSVTHILRIRGTRKKKTEEGGKNR